jgi:putative DNA primase/helicase
MTKKADLATLIANAPEFKPDDQATELAGVTGGSHIKNLQLMLQEHQLQLITSPAGEIFAVMRGRGHMECHRIKGSTFKTKLEALYYAYYQKAIPANTMTELLGILSGRALNENLISEIYTRLGGSQEHILFDLCNEHWQIIGITPEGYDVQSPQKPRFQRFGGMLPLPHPAASEDLSPLWDILNLPDVTARKLLETWLVTALIPHMHVPLLVLNGEQGSAKSTMTTCIKNLLDPHDAPLKNLPSKEQDLFVMASKCRILAFDNVSGFKKDLSDALCKLITGGAYSCRKLYTDDEEAVIKGHCAVVMNGIPDFLTRGDLIDRALVIQLEPISKANRKDDTTFKALFTNSHPHILGALLWRVVQVLQRLPQIKTESHEWPRMVGFAQVGMALEQINTWPAGSFAQAYEANLKGMNRKGLEASLVATRLLQFMENKPQ